MLLKNITTQIFIKYINSERSDGYLDMTVRCKGYHVYTCNVKNLSITEIAPNLQVQQSETYLQIQMPELYTFLHSWTINCVKCKQGTHSRTVRPLYQHNNNVNYAYWNNLLTSIYEVMVLKKKLYAYANKSGLFYQKFWAYIT